MLRYDCWGTDLQKQPTMKKLTPYLSIVLVFVFSGTSVLAQKKTILVDVGHGQKFYSDPADKASTDLVPTDRLTYMITYMTGELTKNGAAHNASIGYLKNAITKDALAKCDLLFIHAPGSKYTPEECAAIGQFINNGGSLFIVMEEDYWGTLDQINANDIVTPFGITFKSNNPTKGTGGHSKVNEVTKVKYCIPSHGARIVEGGTAFAYTNESDENPIGVYKKIMNGGKIIAMGEGMVSLYMTSWKEVKDYQCSGFMEEVVGWLLAEK
jgi:hypothetical protein